MYLYMCRPVGGIGPLATGRLVRSVSRWGLSGPVRGWAPRAILGDGGSAEAEGGALPGAARGRAVPDPEPLGRRLRAGSSCRFPLTSRTGTAPSRRTRRGRSSGRRRPARSAARSRTSTRRAGSTSSDPRGLRGDCAAGQRARLPRARDGADRRGGGAAGQRRQRAGLDGFRIYGRGGGGDARRRRLLRPGGAEADPGVARRLKEARALVNCLQHVQRLPNGIFCSRKTK